MYESDESLGMCWESWESIRRDRANVLHHGRSAVVSCRMLAAP